MPALIAIVLAVYFMAHIYAFLGSIFLSGMCLIKLLQGKFIRSALYGVFAFGLISWWYYQADVIPDPWAFDWWLKTSFWIVVGACGLVAYIKLCAWGNRRRNARLALAAIPDLQTAIERGDTGNVIPFVKATREERERVLRIQGYRCANPYCNADLRGGVPHWDHIVPRSQGGTDSVHNMQWLCDTCNMNKGDRNWLEFLYRYATSMGQDPNANQKPWKQWVLTRTENGLQCG